MPHIAVERALPSPQAVAVPRLLTVLNGYAARDDFSLTVDLGVANAAVSAPVRVQLSEGRSAAAVPVVLAAREHAGWFPAFDGEVRIEGEDRLSSRLSLKGEYDLPLGALGAIVDRSVLGGAAERSLEAFLERVAADVLDEVRRSELDIRHREGRHT